MTEYTPDQERVAKYIVELTGIGAGDDPIGFLIASHWALSRENADLRDFMRGVARQVDARVKG